MQPRRKRMSDGMPEDGETQRITRHSNFRRQVAIREMSETQGSHTRPGACHANFPQPETRCPDPDRSDLARRRRGVAGPDAVAVARCALRLVNRVLVAG